MSTQHTDANESIDPRTRRALSECMTVVPDVGVARGAPGLYRVVGQNGGTYTVDTDAGACTCPDAEYNLSDREKCKHQRRVAFATAARPIPADADVSVDPLLATALDSTPRRVAADGSGAVPAGESDHVAVIDDDTTDVWNGAFTEYDKYGEPTGHDYVRCRACGIEVVDDHREHATHAADCPHAE